MNAWLLIAAVGLAASSGVPALALRRARDTGQRVATALQVLAAGCGVAAAVQVLALGEGARVQVALSPILPELTLGLDPLSAFFLLPVSVLCACASIFDLGYWPQSQHPRNGRQLRVSSGLLFAGLVLVLAARDGVAFLMAWELMALAAFFLVATEHEKPEVRAAAWIYLAATHAGTLLLIAFFCVWEAASGSFALTPLAADVASAGQRDLLFLLALGGFGLKAGIVPLHFWLPPAHANAPSHVSAVMSGVLIKMGVYGVARAVFVLSPPPVWWGVLLLAVGAVSAVLGVAFAIGQHDLKRLLAYHSIENIGIIFIGLGLALLGRATGHVELLVLGLAGALLHTWNHGLFKGLLFLAAGATIQRTGTREIDRLGGLARSMPFTAACFLVGAVAICGLPPLNGFVSELLTYLGLFHALGADRTPAAAAMIAIPALASVGAMALLCFVKVFGIVYLGAPRTDSARGAADPGLSMRIPMLVLAALCAVIGLAPVVAVPALRRVLADWLPAGLRAADLTALAPIGPISAVGLALAGGAALALVWLRGRRPRDARAVGTWDCGYARPTPRMQYTAASFAQQFVGLSRRLLLPRAHAPRTAELFPGPERLDTHVPDLVLDRVLLPAFRGIAWACSGLRLLQRGRVQVYLLYVFLTLLVLLLLD